MSGHQFLEKGSSPARERRPGGAKILGRQARPDFSNREDNVEGREGREGEGEEDTEGRSPLILGDWRREIGPDGLGWRSVVVASSEKQTLCARLPFPVLTPWHASTVRSVLCLAGAPCVRSVVRSPFLLCVSLAILTKAQGLASCKVTPISAGKVTVSLGLLPYVVGSTLAGFPLRLRAWLANAG